MLDGLMAWSRFLFLVQSLGGLRLLVHFHEQPIGRDIILISRILRPSRLARLRVRPRLPLGRGYALCSRHRREQSLERKYNRAVALAIPYARNIKLSRSYRDHRARPYPSRNARC